MYSLFFTFLDHAFRPNRGLNLADMVLAEEKHTYSGLTYAAAHGLGQLAGEQRPVKRQRGSVLAACGGKLAAHGGFIHAYAHGGNLKGAGKGLVPKENVPVE